MYNNWLYESRLQLISLMQRMIRVSTYGVRNEENSAEHDINVPLSTQHGSMKSNDNDNNQSFFPPRSSAQNTTLSSETRKNVGKKLRRLFTPQEKINAINRVRNGEAKMAVSRKIGVPESTLRGWCKTEAKIRKELYNMETSNSQHVSTSSSGNSDINRENLLSLMLINQNTMMAMESTSGEKFNEEPLLDSVPKRAKLDDTFTPAALDYSITSNMSSKKVLDNAKTSIITSTAKESSEGKENSQPINAKTPTGNYPRPTNIQPLSANNATATPPKSSKGSKINAIVSRLHAKMSVRNVRKETTSNNAMKSINKYRPY